MVVWDKKNNIFIFPKIPFLPFLFNFLNLYLLTSISLFNIQSLCKHFSAAFILMCTFLKKKIQMWKHTAGLLLASKVLKSSTRLLSDISLLGCMDESARSTLSDLKKEKSPRSGAVAEFHAHPWILELPEFFAIFLSEIKVSWSALIFQN